jgi:hypothetical protein
LEKRKDSGNCLTINGLRNPDDSNRQNDDICSAISGQDESRSVVIGPSGRPVAALELKKPTETEDKPMSVKLAAIEAVYSVLEHPMANDHRALRTDSNMRNAANADLARKIVTALQKSNLLQDETGEFPGQVRS